MADKAKPYAVTVNDCCGPLIERCVVTFSEALDEYKSLRAKYSDRRRHIVTLQNQQECDYNHDGLTNAQRDRLDSL